MEMHINSVIGVKAFPAWICQPTCASRDVLICGVKPVSSAPPPSSQDHWHLMSTLLPAVGSGVSGGVGVISLAQCRLTSRQFGRCDSSLACIDTVSRCVLWSVFENDNRVWAAVRSRHQRHSHRSEQTHLLSLSCTCMHSSHHQHNM